MKSYIVTTNNAYDTRLPAYEHLKGDNPDITWKEACEDSYFESISKEHYGALVVGTFEAKDKLDALSLAYDQLEKDGYSTDVIILKAYEILLD